MKSITSMIIALGLIFSACGEDEDPMEPEIMVGTECVDLTGCGAGTANAKTVSFCEHCFARPDTHVCEAGICRELDVSGSLSFVLGVPPSATGAKSWTQAAINPVKSDGTRVTCAELINSTDYVDNFAYNTGNSNFKIFASRDGADPGLVYPSTIFADAGTDRLLVIRVVSETQGKGTVLAVGCAEGIEVVAGQTTSVNINLEPAN